MCLELEDVEYFHNRVLTAEAEDGLDKPAQSIALVLTVFTGQHPLQQHSDVHQIFSSVSETLSW